MITTSILRVKNTPKGLLLSLCFNALVIAFAFSSSASASSVKELKSQKINEILFNIKTYYVDDLTPKTTPPIKYNNQQFEHVYAKLDAYSKYLDEHELTALFNSTNGRYTGLGIEVKKIEKKITIINVVNNSPAKNAGVLSNDIIVSVNGKITQDLTVDQVATVIRDSDFANINLTIQRGRNNTQLYFNVVRTHINLKSVTSRFLGFGIGYLAINTFSNNTLNEVALHIAKLQSNYSDQLKGLVIDLRNNPGGTLQSAVAVSDLFLQHGTIVTTKGRFLDANHSFYAKQGDVLKGEPLIVLINEKSASAAEILAAALKENKRATVVGNQSFGKGSVQSLIPLGDGSTALKLTTAKYFTPSGKSIDGVGITPDVVVNQTNLSLNNKAVIIKNEKTNNTQKLSANNIVDLQLLKAKQLLSTH